MPNLSPDPSKNTVVENTTSSEKEKELNTDSVEGQSSQQPGSPDSTNTSEDNQLKLQLKKVKDKWIKVNSELDNTCSHPKITGPLSKWLQEIRNHKGYPLEQDIIEVIQSVQTLEDKGARRRKGKPVKRLQVDSLFFLNALAKPEIEASKNKAKPPAVQDKNEDYLALKELYAKNKPQPSTPPQNSSPPEPSPHKPPKQTGAAPQPEVKEKKPPRRQPRRRIPQARGQSLDQHSTRPLPTIYPKPAPNQHQYPMIGYPSIQSQQSHSSGSKTIGDMSHSMDSNHPLHNQQTQPATTTGNYHPGRYPHMDQQDENTPPHHYRQGGPHHLQQARSNPYSAYTHSEVPPPPGFPQMQTQHQYQQSNHHQHTPHSRHLQNLQQNQQLSSQNHPAAFPQPTPQHPKYGYPQPEVRSKVPPSHIQLKEIPTPHVTEIPATNPRLLSTDYPPTVSYVPFATVSERRQQFNFYKNYLPMPDHEHWPEGVLRLCPRKAAYRVTHEQAAKTSPVITTCPPAFNNLVIPSLVIPPNQPFLVDAKPFDSESYVINILPVGDIGSNTTTFL